MADAADIKTGLAHLAGSDSKYKAKRTQVDAKTFDSLVAALNTWLEVNGKSTVGSADDKKLVARVIAHDASLATSFIPAPNGKIGPYAKGELLPLAAATATGPTYSDLDENFSFKQWPAVRADVARVLRINDKGHSSHGSNFKGNQSLRQVIDNLVDTVKGEAEVARIQSQLRQHYPGYL